MRASLVVLTLIASASATTALAEPAVGRDLSAPPHTISDPRGWVTPSDYPASAMRARAEGVVKTALDLDAAGHVTGCTVARSSGNEALDAQTCALLTRRAAYSPALGPDGQPAASRVERFVRWQVP